MLKVVLLDIHLWKIHQRFWCIPIRENYEFHWGEKNKKKVFCVAKQQFRWIFILSRNSLRRGKLCPSAGLCFCTCQWCHKMRFLSVTFFFCPSWEFTIVLRAMSLTLKTLQSQGLFFFFFLSWGTRFWLLGHLLFPGRGSNAYYSPLICPAIIKSLEAVTDCPESDITSEDA